MLQPFERLRQKDIDRLREMKRSYLVSQTYHRAVDMFADEKKTDLLLSDYDDHGLAKIHYNAVKKDPKAAIIDLENPKHLATIGKMFEPGSSYNLYWAVVKSREALEENIMKLYSENMRRYIDNRTNWKVKGSDTLMPVIQMTFGELFIVLKYQRQTLRIKFEEIEAY